MKLPLHTAALVLGAFVSIGAFSCASVKPQESAPLTGVTWELEYLTGPRIAFDGLFPEKKPRLTFDASTRQVQGSDSCNGYASSYTSDGSSLSFGEPGPTTMMYCGEGEGFFLRTLPQVDRYAVGGDGKLELLRGEVALMRFKPVNPG